MRKYYVFYLGDEEFYFIIQELDVNKIKEIYNRNKFLWELIDDEIYNDSLLFRAENIDFFCTDGISEDIPGVAEHIFITGGGNIREYCEADIYEDFSLINEFYKDNMETNFGNIRMLALELNKNKELFILLGIDSSFNDRMVKINMTELLKEGR